MFTGALENVIMKVNGTANSNIILNEGNNDVLEIILSGIITDNNFDERSTTFTWNGKNNQGQYVSSGVYYLKIAEKDPYGHEETTIRDVSVINNMEYVRLTVFNSAGEIVFSSTTYGQSLNWTYASIDLPDIAGITDEKSTLIIKYSESPLDFIRWDFTNNNGNIISPGVYEVQVVIKDLSTGYIMLTKTIEILRLKKTFLGDVIIVPNPYYMNSNQTLKIRWDFGYKPWQANPSYGISGQVNLKIFNVLGELIRTINSSLNSGYVIWDLKTNNNNMVSPGIYIIVLDAKTADGYQERKILKAGVM